MKLSKWYFALQAIEIVGGLIVSAFIALKTAGLLPRGAMVKRIRGLRVRRPAFFRREDPSE